MSAIAPTQPKHRSGQADLAVVGPPATSLARALRVLGDPWTMLIVKEAFNGARRFGDFQRILNIPKQTLTLRLADLCEQQMFHRRYMNANAGTLLYVPTPKMFDLRDAMYSVWLWHRANPEPVAALPFDLVHEPCGTVLSATYRCRHCGDGADSHSVSITRTQPEQFETEPRPRLSRRNDGAITAGGDAGDRVIAASLVGDAVCNEILYALFQGPRHVLQLVRELQIGQLVIRDRANKLLELGLIAEEQRGRKSQFSVLPRAEAFFPLIMSIAAWGDRWCNGTAPPPEIRLHTCGHQLAAHYRCEVCNGPINRDTIRVVPHAPPEEQCDA